MLNSGLLKKKIIFLLYFQKQLGLSRERRDVIYVSGGRDMQNDISLHSGN